jgi:hypothetical protein
MNELKWFMLVRDIKEKDIANALNVSLTTVRIWKCKSERNITPNNMKLLKLLFPESVRE